MDARSRLAADDIENITAAKNTDAESLFRKYGPMVIRRCRQILGNDDEAADAAQEVFVKLIASLDPTEVEYPSSLLWKMATNRCLSVLRERARRGGNEDGESLLEKIACSNCDNDIEARVGSRGILRKLFRKHPESSRVIAVLHLFDGMTLEETAKEAGMSVSGVRKRLRALRNDLKEMRNSELQLKYGGIL